MAQEGNEKTNINSNSSENSTGFNLNDIKAQQAIFEHEQDIYNNSSGKPAGAPDKFGDVRLKIARIKNYLIKNDTDFDPLDTTNVINMSSGKVVIEWINYEGGVIRPESYGYPNDGYTEPWTYFPDKDSKYPETRTLNCYNHDKASDKETLDLTHAFIWSTKDNWCGINHMPPVGSIVIVGFEKNNKPVILGYLTNNYTTNTPFLKPGEVMIKGYGNNYIHNRWSDKLDIHVQSKKGKIDVDDPYKQDTYPNDIDMWIRFNPYTRNILIDVNQTDNDAKHRTTIQITPESTNISTTNATDNTSALVDISPDSMYASINSKTESSSYMIEPNGINVNTDGDLNITAKGNVNIKGKIINLN